MPELSRRLFMTGAVASAALAAAPQAVEANSQIVGTWTLTSIYRELEDGTKVQNMGERPQGLLFFDAHGRFSHQLMRAGGGRFDCKAIENAAPENMAAVIGVSSYFGTYEMTPEGDGVVFNIESSLIPRQIGAKQKRFIKVTADTMEYWTPKIPSAKGAFMRRLVWQRV